MRNKAEKRTAQRAKAKAKQVKLEAKAAEIEADDDCMPEDDDLTLFLTWVRGARLAWKIITSSGQNVPPRQDNTLEVGLLLERKDNQKVRSK